MVVMTVQLPPDKVPYINPNTQEAGLELAAAVADQLGQSMFRNPALQEIAKQFASGQHVVYVTLHTEPALVIGPSRS